MALLRGHIDEMLVDRAAVEARNKELAQRAEVTPLFSNPYMTP